MASGDTAKKLAARGYRRHAYKDNSKWEYVTTTVTTAATVLKQGESTTTKARFYPTVREVNEFEAENLGANILSGDLKLGVDGFVAAFQLTTPILCDDHPVDVKKVIRRKRYGKVVGYDLYVERRDRKEP